MEEEGIVTKGTSVLLVSATGGFTHAAPLLELGRILSARGHCVDFATHQGQQKWVDRPEYQFLSHTYTMGPGMDAETEAKHYMELQSSDIRKDYHKYFEPKLRIDAFWTSDYRHLKKIVEASRPDMMVADFFVDAAVRDIQAETGIPLAVLWPQMPYGMVSAPHIPGFPGFQVDALTSEHASLWTRIRAALRPLRSVTSVITYIRFTNRMRREAGLPGGGLPFKNKPDHLVLVNSFWGLETPKDLPPLVAAIGPILSDDYEPLDGQLDHFYDCHTRVIYVAFGTHIQVLPHDLEKFLVAFARLMDEGIIDGVVWAAGTSQRTLFDHTLSLPDQKHTVGELLENKSDHWLFTPFAPQRAVLERPETVLFATHGGGSSVNEALFHGTPMLVLGFFADQPLNGLRVAGAGCGLYLDKADFSAGEVYDKARRVLLDETGAIAQDVLRMRHIAAVSARKKEHGADLVEEMLFDAKYSMAPPEERRPKGGRRRPMHLQTADARMPGWKVNNWDLKLIGVLTVASLTGVGYFTYRLFERRL